MASIQQMKSAIGQNQCRYDQVFTTVRSNLSGLNLPPELIDEIIARQITVSFEKGAMLFGEGTTDGMLACVLTGYVSVYCPVGDGDRTLYRLAGPGEIIGYPDYVDRSGRRARMFEAMAASKCTVGLFSRDQVIRLFSTLAPDHLVTILTSLNTFWSENLRYFATLLSLPLSERLTIVLDDLAARAGVHDAEGVILIPELGHDDLAEMIGCSRPMVSRMIADMIRRKKIAKRDKQYVLLRNLNVNKQDSKPASKPGKVAVDGAPFFVAPAPRRGSLSMVESVPA
jgi:CRP/FNR family transcriptional regulator, cyclic AMP receptor protein